MQLNVAVQAFYKNFIAFETGIGLEIVRKTAATLPMAVTSHRIAA